MLEVRKILPKVYWLAFEDKNHLAKTFLRFQEFYESPKFKGQSFTIAEYETWYQEYFEEETFTYCEDWTGFNIPSKCVAEVEKLGIPDLNYYDGLMLGVFHTLRAEEKNTDFYLIGSQQKDQEVLLHEVAHGLFATNTIYQINMIRLVESLPKDIYAALCEKFVMLGYTSEVFVDEAQAYLATGYQVLFDYEAPEAIEKYQEEFQEIFVEFISGHDGIYKSYRAISLN